MHNDESELTLPGDCLLAWKTTNSVIFDEVGKWIFLIDEGEFLPETNEGEFKKFWFHAEIVDGSDDNGVEDLILMFYHHEKDEAGNTMGDFDKSISAITIEKESRLVKSTGNTRLGFGLEGDVQAGWGGLP